MKKHSKPLNTKKRKTAAKKSSGSRKREPDNSDAKRKPSGHRKRPRKLARDSDGRFKRKPSGHRKRPRKLARDSGGRFKRKQPLPPKRKQPLPPKRKPSKKRHPAQLPKRGKRRTPPKGYKLGEARRFVEPYERVAYTFRVEALATLTTKYQGVSFDPAIFEKRKLNEDEVTLQVFHTPFAATEAQAFDYFKERVQIMRAYGGITFIEISLWKVSGEGPMKEKKWDIIESFDEPEDVVEQFEG